MNTKPRQSDYHPHYDAERDSQFTKELYRLKGFAYLRTQEKQQGLTTDIRSKFSQNELVMQEMSVVKAATCFQKALGNESKDFQQVMKQINKQKSKKQKKQKVIDEYSEVNKVRVTFLNFRKKIEGNLVEDENTLLEDLQNDDNS